MTCDVITLSKSCRMLDDVIFLASLSTIDQLESLLMPKYFGGGSLVKGCFQLSTTSIDALIYFIWKWPHIYIYIYIAT